MSTRLVDIGLKDRKNGRKEGRKVETTINNGGGEQGLNLIDLRQINRVMEGMIFLRNEF